MVTFRASNSEYNRDKRSSGLNAALLDSENVFIDDSRVNKYKDNEREVKREVRYNQNQRD